MFVSDKYPKLNRFLMLEYAVALLVLIFYVRTPVRLELDPLSSLLLALHFWSMIAGVVLAYYTYYHIPLFVRGSFLLSMVVTYALLISIGIWILAIAKVFELDFIYTLPSTLLDWVMTTFGAWLTTLTQDHRSACHFLGYAMFAGLAGLYLILVPVFGKANKDSGGYGQGVAILSGLYLAFSIAPLVIIYSLLSV